MKRLHISILILAIFTLFTSCKSESNEPETPKDTRRTILVYMIASNSLSGYDTKDINEMITAVENETLNDCRLFVYQVKRSTNPQLIEIKKVDGEVKKVELKEYSSSIASTTVERMSEVIKDIKEISPAPDYGLILWSHANGWALSLPKSSNYSLSNYLNEPLPLYRNFGDDNGSQMKLDELAQAIPDNMFNFIYVDACYMGGIEEAYQLRNKAKYYIGSTALLPANGMPYDQNIPEFCKNTPDLQQACENTYNYYNSLSGSEKTITISLTDCNQLENMATVCRNIISSSDELTDISDMQGYIVPSEAKCIYFDFAQYYRKRASASLTEAFNSALSKTVIYKATSGNVFNNLIIEQEHFSGLSTYISGTSNNANEEYYKTLDWYQATQK